MLNLALILTLAIAKVPPTVYRIPTEKDDQIRKYTIVEISQPRSVTCETLQQDTLTNYGIHYQNRKFFKSENKGGTLPPESIAIRGKDDRKEEHSFTHQDYRVVVETYFSNKKKADPKRSLSEIFSNPKLGDDDDPFQRYSDASETEWSVFANLLSSDVNFYNARKDAHQAVELISDTAGLQCFPKTLRIHDYIPGNPAKYRIIELDDKACATFIEARSNKSLFQKLNSDVKENFNITAPYLDYCEWILRASPLVKERVKLKKDPPSDQATH